MLSSLFCSDTFLESPDPSLTAIVVRGEDVEVMAVVKDLWREWKCFDIHNNTSFSACKTMFYNCMSAFVLTWKGYLKLHGIGTSLHTISTHLILDSSMQPLIIGFFWKNVIVTLYSIYVQHWYGFNIQQYIVSSLNMCTLTPGRRSEYLSSWVSNTKNLSL